ncbi:MAG: asparagine synthetase B family protein, partial [Alphaproteobacteria bacterium]
LSGGLDSGAIACLARRLIGDDDRYDVFTGRFPGSDADEGEWARIIANSVHATSHETFPTGEKLVASLDDFLWFNELPVDSTSQFAQWCVFEKAREAGVAVLLDGQGSDEILAGYEQYFAAYIATRRAGGAYDAAEERAIGDRYPMAFSERDQDWKTRIPLSAKKLLSRMLGTGTDILLAMKPDLARQVRDNAAAPPAGLHAVLRRDSFNGFLTTLLRYGDRNSMAHSREVRLPFCDHRISEFISTLPAEMLMGNAQTKYLLRRSMDGLLPDSIVNRWNKQGFLPPIAEWLNGGLGEHADDLFGDVSFAGSPQWDARWCRHAWQRFKTGDATLAPTIWKILISELWRDRFLKRASGMKRHAPTE